MLYALRFGYRHEVDWENQDKEREFSGKNAYKNFKKGAKYHGTVLQWLEKGVLFLLENSKKEDNKVTGMISMKSMEIPWK